MESVGRMFTLDTNILIAHFNDEPKVEAFLRSVRAEGKRLFISVVTEIELLALPRLTPEEIEAIERLLREFSAVPLDSQLGKLTASVRRTTKLALGDSVVVATAVFTNSTLVTRDREILKRAKGIVRT